jgi:PHD/YefM family antitoxin component YafN of YafNO toxin-antitoxin module
MSRQRSYSGVLGEWRRMSNALELHAADLAHLEGSRTKLATSLDQMEQLFQQQKLRQSEKQGASKQLRQLVNDVQRLVTLLRQGVKERYGINSETLVEFGVRPFRGRTKPDLPTPPGVELARLTEGSGEPVIDLKAERVEES